MPRHAAPPELLRKLGHRPPARWRAVATPLATPLAVSAALVMAAVALFRPFPSTGAPSSSRMLEEAVNDHLRVLYSEHPLEVAGGGIHQVKPWFQGRLDFAPQVAFAGDDEFPLAGGAVGYFVDRKAAVFVYKRRLHTISLLVFRGDGLPWPGTGPRAEKLRGFSVLLWQGGALGHALVSDADPAELETLKERLTAPAR